MQENQTQDKSEPVSSETPSPATKTGSDKVSRKSQRKINRSSKSEVLTARRRTNPVVWLLILVNTLVVAALCGGAFYAWMQWQSLQASQAEREAGLRQELDTTVTQQLSNIKASAATELAALESKLTTQVSVSDTKLDEMAEQLAGLQSATATDWDQAQLRYLVKMAQYKIIVENNVQAAIVALTEAESTLAKSSDVQYLPLREAIVSDLQRLTAVDVDVQMRSLVSLTALIQSSSDLLFPKPNDFYNPDKPKVSGDMGDWWQNMRINISNLLMIDYDFELENSIKPFLTKQQKEMIRASLQYHLLTARHALIKQDENLYRISMEATFGMLDKFEFNSSRESFEQVLQQLEKTEFPRKSEFQLSSVRYFLGKESQNSTNPDNSREQEL